MAMEMTLEMTMIYEKVILREDWILVSKKVIAIIVTMSEIVVVNSNLLQNLN